jgi:hypothetical protein
MPTRSFFYHRVLDTISAARVPFLVGGAFSLCRYVGVKRGTHDLDLMVCEEDWPTIAQALRREGIVAKLVFPHWLGKALALHAQVDIIFNGGNGATPVTRDWFAFATTGKLMGRQVQFCPPEELLWSKSFVMERERFDGGDVLHLLRVLAQQLDWERLLLRFRGHEAVLRAHLILFSYVYPGEASRVPAWVDARLAAAGATERVPPDLCRGTLLSRAQYLVDVESGGYRDARLPPFGRFTDRAWLAWTNAIDSRMSRVRPGRRRSAPRRKASAEVTPGQDLELELKERLGRPAEPAVACE